MKRLNRYRIVFGNESKLRRLGEVRFTLWQGITAAIVAVAICFVLAGALIMVTPLKRLLPGYLKESQRDNTIEALMLCDSLQTAYEANQRYLDNLRRVMDTERSPADSLKAAKAALPMSVDSLLDASAEETKFMRMMEEREKYNISILAPMAADAMIMSDISRGFAISSRSAQARKAEVITARNAPIFSISDGIVIDTHYSPKESGYILVIQHDRGFLSRYSHLSGLLVKAGDKVTSGQIVSDSPKASGATGHFYFELWRNGSPLIPSKFIANAPTEREKKPEVDVDVGRGR